MQSLNGTAILATGLALGSWFVGREIEGWGWEDMFVVVIFLAVRLPLF